MPVPSLAILRTQSDERLVELARAGHERAFEAIVERYRSPLHRAARRVLPEARAEDALQQALIGAWSALQRGDPVHNLRSWLYRIVHNTALNALRVSGYDYDELEAALRIADGGDEELERRAVVRQTLAGLAALPERQREALLRTAVSGYSQEEVARDLGISDNAMRQLLHRARVTMRTAVTAVTPLPLVTALAARGRGGPIAERIAELIAGAAPVGAATTLAKAGTVAVIAGGAISGPAIVDRLADRPPRNAKAASAGPARKAKPAAARTSASGPPRTVSATFTPAADAAGRATLPGRPVRRRASRRNEDRRGTRVGGEGGQREPEDGSRAPLEPDEGDDRSGHGSDEESGERSPGGDGLANEVPEHSSERSGSSGGGAGPDREAAEPNSAPLAVEPPAPLEAPEPLETPDPDGSHGGSGSGSGSGDDEVD